MKAAVNVGGVVVELERVESWWGGGWVYSFTLKRDGAAVEYGITAVSALATCDAAIMAACSRIHAMGVKAWATSAAQRKMAKHFKAYYCATCGTVYNPARH